MTSTSRVEDADCWIGERHYRSGKTGWTFCGANTPENVATVVTGFSSGEADWIPRGRLVVDRVGAYSLASAIHTNAMPKPPVVLDRGGGVDLLRRAETCDDGLGDDRIPMGLG